MPDHPQGKSQEQARPRGQRNRGLKRTPGPRPLPLHLMAARNLWQSSRNAYVFSKTASPLWHPSMRDALAALQNQATAIPPRDLAGALQVEADRRFAAFLDGVEAYRDHPYQRDLTLPAAIWSEGTTQVLSYENIVATEKAPNAQGTKTSSKVPIVVVPSLVNKSYILDLDEETSLLRFLRRQGHPVYLVDWGKPGQQELKFNLDDYIADRLMRIVATVATRESRPPVLMGYCMGGLLTLPISVLRPESVAGLVLMATPWDFHAEGVTRIGPLVRGFEAAINRVGELPIDLIQTLFFALDPLLVLKKFMRFGLLDKQSPQARQFVAVEDWLNDGIALAGPVAQQCFQLWYGENAPAKGNWRVAGVAVDPKHVKSPTLVIVPSQDRIVPPASAAILATQIPHAVRLDPPLGHIGMVVGRTAPQKVWQPLITWLNQFAS